LRGLNGHEGESWTQPRPTWSHRLLYFGGQGVHREVESEGPAEKYRTLIDGVIPKVNRSAKVGQGRVCVSETKALSMSEKPVHSRLRRLAGWINLTGAKKVHSLIDKVYERKNLEMAWEKVKANRGSGGVDG
jgi:hypothetical protein